MENSRRDYRDLFYLESIKLLLGVKAQTLVYIISSFLKHKPSVVSIQYQTQRETN